MTYIEEVIPDACVEPIFNFGSPYSEASVSNARQLPNLCLIGLLSKPLKLRANGLVKIVAVRFFAWGALTFLKNAAKRNRAMQVDLDRAWKDFKAFADRTPGEYASESRHFQEMFRDHKNVVFLQSLPTMPDYNGQTIMIVCLPCMRQKAKGTWRSSAGSSVVFHSLD